MEGGGGGGRGGMVGEGVWWESGGGGRVGKPNLLFGKPKLCVRQF